MESPEYMDTPEYDRNPSPPPEIAEHPELLRAESIGNTAFSKHWLFTTLIKLIEEVDRENEEESNLAVDVDEELQNELCKLWDMSMNSDVAKFLNEFKAVDILTGIIEKSKAPRVIEISVGILGNMACEQAICKEMSENHKFINLVILLMETRDAPTLVETARLIYTSLSNTGTRGPWISAIQRSEEVLDHLKFIFSSSTNCDLLKNTAELVDTLLDLEPDLCVSWATIDFIHSLIEATEQIGSNHSEALEVYLHIFQSFSTTEPGVEALVGHTDRLEMKIIKYLNIVCEYEIVGLDGKEAPLSSALSVLNILFTSQPVEKLGHLYKDEKIMRILLKILEPLYPMLQRYMKAEQTNSNEPVNEKEDSHVTSSDQSDAGKETDSSNNADNIKDTEEKDKNGTRGTESEEYKELKVLYEILSAFLLDYCNIAFMDKPNIKPEDLPEDSDPSADSTPVDIQNDNNSQAAAHSSQDSSKEGNSNITEDSQEKESDSETQELKNSNKNENSDTETSEEKKPCIDNVPILTYLDEVCSRWRINNFGLCLKESDAGCRLYDRLYGLAEKNKNDRLCRILTDISEGRVVNRADSGKERGDENVS
ncbi:protein saal1-like [Mercenaria mercenaria]|uniref:protein saal1-like n=1 Tax=Mercenaria mercenaria TaxID=6596 RepID=UPI00234F85B9|nr:protein saal1-like [Mercenaria mercenaria]XP_053384111.1 protein saal1-like [Mercenaria mercenaria]